MALDEQDRHRRVVTVGDDAVVIERTPVGLIAVTMPARREAVGTHAEIEALRDALTQILASNRGQR